MSRDNSQALTEGAIGWPSIGIIIPNFNGGSFLEECIESIIHQSYPNIRCILMDGGSVDNSLDIARNFREFIDIVSEPDRGQADAIRKGFGRMDTELVGWLNSDDRLLPNSLETIALTAKLFPEAVLYHGDVEIIDSFGRLIQTSNSKDLDLEKLRRGKSKVLQPGSFYRREALIRAGNVDYSWDLLMDVDLWIRLLQVGCSRRIDKALAQFRIHPAAKSSRVPFGYYKETLKLTLRHERNELGMALPRRTWQITQHFIKHVIRNLSRLKS